jgi:glutaredoxin-like protein NrdH
MGDQSHKVEFYGLTTCGWCKKTENWLKDKGIECRVTYVNKLEGDERKAVKDRILQFAPKLSFPVVIIDDGNHVVQGFKPEKFEEIFK